MTKRQLHQLRYEFDRLYHVSFDNLSGKQRLKFLELISMIDSQIRAMEEFNNDEN